MDNIVIDTTHPSPNKNHRIFYLILHYTVLNFEDSKKVLTDPQKQVSAHYLIPETRINGQRKIFKLVQENERAWHAGISSWGKRTNINDTSIGIEIVNLGYKDEESKRKWYPFSHYQIQMIIELAKDIVERYKIQPINVIGHSDVAPGRKVDPGPLFPWEALYENGVGSWFNEEELIIQDQATINIQQLQSNLKTYGYDIEITGKLDQQTRNVLQAFQMHFNPSNYSGEPDARTIAILENLVQKYFPKQTYVVNEEKSENRVLRI